MISVIVPVYNSEKYLNECLLSLHNQTLNDVEFIIVDDGSTDNSFAIIEKWNQIDSRFRCFRKENGGQVSAYLFGFEKSLGDYIGFVDSDDIALPNMFETLYTLAKNNHSDVVICRRRDFIDNIEEGIPEKILIDEGSYKENISKVWDLTLPPFNGVHMHNSRWNKIYKRSIFEQNICYCKEMVRTFEDRFIVPACIFASKSIYITNDVLYCYRQLPYSSKSKARPELFDILKLLEKRQKEMLIRYNLFDQYKGRYELACLNYLSLYINRNIVSQKKFKDKYRYSKLFIKNKDIISNIKMHKKELDGNTGKALKLISKIKSPLLFALLSFFK